MNNTFTERIGRRTLRRFLLFFFAILIIVFACLMHTNYSSKLSPKKIDTHEMYNGTQTELMGKYGIIHMKAKKLNKRPYQEIKDFVQWYKDQNGTYVYVTIDFGNNTGIEIFGGTDPYITYGAINNDGVITTTIGTIEDKGSYYSLYKFNDQDKLVPVSNSKEPYGINGLPVFDT